MKQVIVTGATGAIGVALIYRLAKENIKILVLANPNSKRNQNIPNLKNVSVIQCALDNLDELNLKERYDAFFHLAWVGGAARDNVDLQTKNIEYTLKAVRLAAKTGCGVFVGAGSQAEYGKCDTLLDSKVATFPTSAFGATKLYAGQLSRVYAQQHGIRHIWTRILSVYGPYDGEHTMVISTIKSILNQETPKLTLCEQEWDFLYSDDAAAALYQLSLRGVDGRVYCIGNGKGRKLKEFVEILRNKIDKTVELGFGKAEIAQTKIINLRVDISELTQDTGFVPSVPFEEGIQRTIDWMKTTREMS